MVAVGRYLTLGLSAVALTLGLGSASAFAAGGGGIDTPSGVISLPLSVEGNTILNVQPNGLSFNPGMQINNLSALNMTGDIAVNAGAGQALEINSNQIWKSVTTGDPSLYLQYSNPNGQVVIGGQPGKSNNLVVQGYKVGCSHVVP